MDQITSSYEYSVNKLVNCWDSEYSVESRKQMKLQVDIYYFSGYTSQEHVSLVPIIIKSTSSDAANSTIAPSLDIWVLMSSVFSSDNGQILV